MSIYRLKSEAVTLAKLLLFAEAKLPSKSEICNYLLNIVSQNVFEQII